ncbi:MAG: GNAT family N-acetyltransferase [Phycisphaeraceae bacterium JB051]
MSIKYVLIEGLPEQHLDAICHAADTFEPIPRDGLVSHLNHQHNILSCFAYDGDQLVGYKIGYQIRQYYFESWIGGVIPSHRRQGIASRLIKLQHQWCFEHGFHYVSTMTEGNNQAMIITNLKAGFGIIGTMHTRNQILIVIMEKHLR